MNINEPSQGRGFALPFTKAADPRTVCHAGERRVPFLRAVPDSLRNHFIAMCGEFVGTVLFLYFALSGCQVANSIPSSSGLTVDEIGSNPQQLQYIALAFGFSLAVNAWVFFRISGGLFNPAVTVGMCLVGALPWIRGVLLFIVQVLGGIVASALVSCMFPGPLKVETQLGGNTSITQGLFIEMMLTAQLVFTIFMLAAEKHKGTFIAPVGIGLSLFVAEITGVYFTGGSLNPARSFGPAVINRHFVGYHWIYWVGPLLGAVVAAGFYKFIKMLEYETANPGQDATAHHEAETMRRARGASNGATVLGSVGGATNGVNGAAGVPASPAPGYQADGTGADGASGTAAGGEKLGQGFGAAPANGGVSPTTTVPATPGALGRPEPPRQTSGRARVESPAMGSAEDAYYGLAHGMHHHEERGAGLAAEGAGLRVATRSPGQVV